MSENTGHRPPSGTKRMLVVSALALLAAMGGAAWITARPNHESTDDAYTAADVTTVAPRVKGFIAAVLIRDNQPVHKGDLLATIDPEEFDAKLRRAQAIVASADADIAAERAALLSLTAEERLADANVVAAQTAIRASGADADRARNDRQRYDALATSGSVSKRDIDIYKTMAIDAAQAHLHAQALVLAAQRAVSVLIARRATLNAALQKAEAGKAQADADLLLAQQDEHHTRIVAAIDGVVGNRQVRVGDYVQPGTRLLTLVPIDALYVTANFKETQTRYMRIGQKVTIDVDALSQPLTGTVDSLAPGSGSTFALLPFEPGTGNFTKIVQRVPVRIQFDPGQPGLAQLRSGLSVTATVNFTTVN